MQASAPELIDLSKETQETLDAYGAEAGQARRSPTTACWPAGWSSAACGSCSSITPTGTITATRQQPRQGRSTRSAEQVDQPMAALVTDLKQRGLLDDTLVIWGGEFGRTPMGEVRDTVGRNHHIDAYTMWLAGGGVKPGITLGETDEFGFSPTADRVHVHDLQATILHLLGPRSHEADLPLPGPRLPADRRAWGSGEEAAGVRPAADDPRPAHDAGQMPISKSRKLSSPARSPRLPSKSRMPSKFRPHRMLRSCPSSPPVGSASMSRTTWFR